MSNFDISSASFNAELRMLETTDPAHADVFNLLFGQLIKNDVAIMRAAGQFAGSKNAQAEFLLNMRKDGRKYGVHFDDYAISPSTVGTRLYDNVGLVCKPSTNTVRGQNDLEGTSVFYHLEVNGYVDSDGEFQVEYIKGIDDEFSRTEHDTWILQLTQYINLSVDASGENLILSDTRHDSSWVPEGKAIRPDGTIRPFTASAKYLSGDNADGVASSISGVSPKNYSFQSSLTKFRAKGNQYCAETSQDRAHFHNLFQVAFASRNSQSYMTGCSSYYYQYQATVVEADVERIIIAKSNANNLVVGSTVSIGNATALSNGNPNNDRGQNGMHAKANRVRIVKIEAYDDNNSAVYVDNGDVKFSTGANMVDSVSCPTILSTMPWNTGGCDDVLGSCGSPTSNTSSKEPYILFGVEMSLGFWEPLGNTVMKITDHVMVPYICYDCTKMTTAGATTDDWVAVGYSIPNNKGWKYISRLGYDPENPSVRFASECEADSSKGYADGTYTQDLETQTDGQREVLVVGSLSSGAPDGLWLANLSNGLSDSSWVCAARLSASGRCAQKAAA